MIKYPHKKVTFFRISFRMIYYRQFKLSPCLRLSSYNYNCHISNLPWILRKNIKRNTRYLSSPAILLRHFRLSQKITQPTILNFLESKPLTRWTKLTSHFAFEESCRFRLSPDFVLVDNLMTHFKMIWFF